MLPYSAAVFCQLLYTKLVVLDVLSVDDLSFYLTSNLDFLFTLRPEWVAVMLWKVDSHGAWWFYLELCFSYCPWISL